MDENKLRTFEYIVIQLSKQYLGLSLENTLTNEEVEKFNNNNDFSKLKLLKLLFLVCIASPNKDLLNTFNLFYAMEYGPVESSIYNQINEDDSFTNIRFSEDKKKIKIKCLDRVLAIDCVDYKLIDISISKLHLHNNRIVKMQHWALVDLTHKYNSWQYAINKANASNKKAFPMSIEDIKKDDEVFSL